MLNISLVEAGRNVVPVSATAAESVERLRTWASGRCLSAYQSGLYRRDPSTPDKPVRRVTRESAN